MDKEQRSHLDSFAPLDDAPPEEAVVAAGEMVDYMLGQPTPPTPGPQSQVSFDKLTFSDVLQFADFGPKLALNQPKASENGGGGDDDDDDDSYFLRFQSLPSLPTVPPPRGAHPGDEQEGSKQTVDAGGVSESTTLVQQADGGGAGGRADKAADQGKSGRRKRPRTVKTSEEVESQRMTHIAVERNRRRQMNEYLRVLRSLMPGSYVQRGDQASIIGGAIEFIRELEQLIQCLESQKRRRLYGGDAPPRPVADGAAVVLPAPMQQQQPQPQPPATPFFPPSIPFPASSGGDGSAGAKILDLDANGGGGDVVAGGLREEMAENKSCLADIEVRLLGVDAMIKILSRRRPGQLIKTVAALEDMQMSILHTNITTIDQTVLYSFNVKIAGEARFSAEDIAGAVHQILSFIDVNYTL
ncbi:transcription factor FAMA isoform X1 [Oryza brachyantha]|uniref:transcription factor FAMA isoform X1 n=2 Tax=Oryza brachyantha TaxID=4533 RepID=UPI001ADBFF02|nr:transcription factor FAMA isoform X1 [Oryza brachyantha]